MKTDPHRLARTNNGQAQNRTVSLQVAAWALKKEAANRRKVNAKLAAYANLGRQLNSATRRDEAARIIVGMADKLIGWDACFLILCRKEDKHIVPILGMDTINGQRVDASHNLIMERPGRIFRRVLRKGGEIIFRRKGSRDLVQLTPFGKGARRSKSMMFVPIRHGDKAVGILSIQSHTPHAYDRDALDTLRSLADHCGGALHRINTEEELERTTADAREKERKLLDAQKVAHLGSWEWDLATDKMILSDEMFRILGLSPREFEPTYQTSFARIHPEDQPTVRARLDQCFKTLEPLLVTLRIVRPDSNIRVIQARGEIVNDQHGKPCRMVGTAQDITEHERVIEALRESEQRFRAVFVRAAVGIAVTDVRGRFIESNAAYRQTTGYSGDELRSMDFLSITHPEDRALNRRLIRQTLSGKTSGFDIEKRYCRKDGRIVWVQNSISLVRDQKGRPAEVIALAQDITERKRAEQLVLGQNRLVELVAQGAALRDTLDAIIQFVEQQATGMICSILLVEPETRRLRLGSAPSLPKEFNKAVDGIEIGPSTGSCGTAAYFGKPVIVSDIGTDPLWSSTRVLAARHNLKACWSSPILSNHGEVLGVFALYYREPRKPNKDEWRLIQIATHVTGMALERQRSDKTLRGFHQRVVEAQEMERRRVSRELHDSVSQLLASIRFRIQSAIESPTEDPAKRMREKVELKLLVDHAMREVRRISRNLRPSELDDLGLESAIGNMAREFDERTRIELAVQFSNLPRRFPPDIELALYRIIQESLRNVEQHSGATRAGIRLTRTRTNLFLKISDNGKGGFASASRARKRSDPGIGLANMRERAAMVGGTFTIDSSYRKGTEITIQIPAEALRQDTRNAP